MTTNNGNPLVSDPLLKALIEESQRIESVKAFDLWKVKFLRRLEVFLDKPGIHNAQKAYEEFQHDMAKLVAGAFLLQKCIDEGAICKNKITVKGLNALNEIQRGTSDAREQITKWLPSKRADEEAVGYNKFELGHVLVSDGFTVYMNMSLCRDMLNKAVDTCLGDVAGRQTLDAIEYYDREIKIFCNILADLGLYETMMCSYNLRSSEWQSSMRIKAGYTSATADRHEEMDSSNKTTSSEATTQPSTGDESSEVTPPPCKNKTRRVTAPSTPPQDKEKGFTFVVFSSPLKCKRTLACGKAETAFAPRLQNEEENSSPRRKALSPAYSHDELFLHHHQQQQQHHQPLRSPRRTQSNDMQSLKTEMASPRKKNAQATPSPKKKMDKLRREQMLLDALAVIPSPEQAKKERRLSAPTLALDHDMKPAKTTGTRSSSSKLESNAAFTTSNVDDKKVLYSTSVESTSLFSPPSPPTALKKQVVLPPPQPLAPNRFNNNNAYSDNTKQALERPQSPKKNSARPTVQVIQGVQPPEPPLALDHNTQLTKTTGTRSSSSKLESNAVFTTSNVDDKKVLYSTSVESSSLFSPPSPPTALKKQVVLPPPQPLAPNRFNNNDYLENPKQALERPQSPKKISARPSVLEAQRPELPLSLEAAAKPKQPQSPRRKKQLILLEPQCPLWPPSLETPANHCPGPRPSNSRTMEAATKPKQPQSPKKIKQLVQLKAQWPLSPPSVETPSKTTKNSEREHKMQARGTGYNRPDIRVRVGSPALDVYNRKLRHDDCVLVPEFFGLEEDFTTYNKVLNELTELQRLKVEGTEWIASPDGDSKHVTCACPGRSPAVREIIRKVAKYFDMNKSTIQFKLDWYRDGNETRAPCQFSEAFEQDGDHVRNLTVEASFGAEREISLQKTTAHTNDGDEWTGTIIHVPQTNNGIFSIGRDVNIRFQNNAIEAEDPENKKRANGYGRISVTVWGQAENALEELGSPPRLQNPSVVKVNKH